MPLLPSLFRGRSNPPSSYHLSNPTTSSSPSRSNSELAPARPYRKPQRQGHESRASSRLKSTDYAITPSKRPLPPTPAGSPLKSGSTAMDSGRRDRGVITPTKPRGRAASSPTPPLVPSSTPRSRTSTVHTPSQTPDLSESPARYAYPQIATPSSQKRRPTALSLQTSNLSPPSAPTTDRYPPVRQNSNRVPNVLSYITEEESAISTSPPSPVPAPSTAGTTTRDDSPFQNFALPWSTVPIATVRSSLAED